MLSTSVKKNIFYARSRKYKNALEAALHANNIPTKVYDNVIESIHKNLTPLHNYMKLRKKLLKLKELKPWDLFVPLIKNIKFDISYPDSLETIESALQPLGEDYISVLKKGFNTGWIDVFENQGKRSGAYSWSTHGTHPFILLNYNNTIDDMFTVAHELGHAIHSHFTHNTQPVIYSGYTTFVAEVASTLNEALLIDYLIRNTRDQRKKFYLLNEYVDQIRGTVYIQALFAEFEKTIHEMVKSGEALIASNLNQLSLNLYSQYLGPAFTRDSLYEINWCRIPHFYYNFYVYKYVTGFSAATAISQKILAGDQKAREAYLQFLSRGSSDYSLNLLKDVGVDMTSPQPIEATTHLMDKLITEMKDISEGM
jgi:oligoendopeptidase F